jgi:hypothetical protein
MIPSIDDRLGSVVRALTDVIMPSLPVEAGLAQEQMQLVIGQIQIIRAQMDAAPAFEMEEAEDARALGKALLEAGEGGSATTAALADLKAATDAKTAPRETRLAIHNAIDSLVRNVAADGSATFRTKLGQIIVKMQTGRTVKDREWFMPMGFDSGI